MEERITLKMLRYFDKVAQLGQFSRAAEQLNITKSPLSAQIKELEDVLGTALFERNTRNVQLTKAGEQLQAECITLFTQFERSIHRVKQCAREEKQQLDIGLMSSIFWAGFGPAFHALQQLMPHATLNLLELSPEKQVRQLLMHQIDLGLVRFADTRDVAPLMSECLYQEFMVVALPNEHPLAQRGQLTLSDLKSADFVMLKQENSSSTRLIVEYCAKAGYRPNIVQEVVEPNTLLAVISARQAVSIVPQSYANLSWPQVRFIPLKQRIPAGVYALYHPETQSNIKRMIDELKQAIEKREKQSEREPGRMNRQPQ